MTGNQNIQEEQYLFPYHYIPTIDPEMWLSRHWGFADSYVAALRIIEQLLSEEFSTNRHIDVGCGSGALIYHLSRNSVLNHVDFQGVDVSERALTWAKAFNSENAFHCCDISQIPSGTFETATLVEVLEHIPPNNLQEFIGELKTVLKPCGILILTVPSSEIPVTSKHYQHFNFEKLLETLEPNFTAKNFFGFEKTSTLVRFLNRIRKNRYFKIDSPLINSFVVSQYMALHEELDGCGRILGIFQRKD